MKAIVTVIGVDKVGIIATVTGILAEYKVNIEDISQTILQEYFTMTMLVDLGGMRVSFAELSATLEQKGRAAGVSIKVQREDIFKAMHQI